MNIEEAKPTRKNDAFWFIAQRFYRADEVKSSRKHQINVINLQK